MLWEMLARDPHHSRAMNRLADVYRMGGGYERAIVLWEKLLRVHQKPSTLEMYIKRQLGLAYEHAKDVQKAAAIWEDMMKRDPQDILLQKKLADAYSVIGDNERAITIWKGLLQRIPDDERVGLMLAAAYETKRDYDRAIAVCKGLLQRLPQSARVQNYLGIVREKKNKKKLRIDRVLNWSISGT